MQYITITKGEYKSHVYVFLAPPVFSNTDIRQNVTFVVSISSNALLDFTDVGFLTY